MGETYKIVVTGAFSVGKTQLIKTISEIPVVSTERRITDRHRSVKEETTVAMDYGQVQLGNDLFHIYGTPGQPRFDFMSRILATGMDALLILVDSSDRETFLVANQLLRRLGHAHDTPCLVVANKQDQPEALKPDRINEVLNLGDDVPVVPCVAYDQSSVRLVMEETRVRLNRG